jgi:hypothetical protein
MLGGTAIKLAPEILAKYTGNYEYAPGRPAVITFEGDLLFLQEGANPLKLPLAPNSETDFVARAIGEHVEFIRDDRGQITGFIYHGERGDRKAVRKGNAAQDRKQ